MKKRKSMKNFWVRKFYNKKEKERETSEAMLRIFTYSCNTTVAFLNIIPCNSHQIWMIVSYGRRQFREGMKIKVIINNKLCVFIVSTYTLFLCSLFWFKHISCIMLHDNLLVKECNSRQNVCVIQRSKKNFKWVELSKQPECSFIIAQLINCACSE